MIDSIQSGTTLHVATRLPIVRGYKISPEASIVGRQRVTDGEADSVTLLAGSAAIDSAPPHRVGA